MNGFRSQLLSSSSRLTEPLGRLGIRMLAGAGVVGLVLAGYTYGPASADRLASMGEPSAIAVIAPIQLAQAPAADAQKQIPLPEPAKIEPPSAADVAPAKADTPAVEAMVPLPEPANVPPITAETISSDKSTTATVPPAAAPAPAPAQASFPPPPGQATAPGTAPAAPAEQTSTPAPAAPQLDAEAIKKLTGKDLVKAPIAANLAVADIGVAEKVREILATRLDRIVDRREDRQAVEAFYRDRGFTPLWIENGSSTPRTTSAIKYLGTVGEEGLEPADYPAPKFNVADAAALADAELRFTSSILDFARHAQTGRVHFSRMSGDVHYELAFPDPDKVLEKLASASDLTPVLASYNPQHEAYKALKAKLAELRGQSPETVAIARIPEGPTLKPGMDDPRVAVLRKRLDIPGDQNSHRYDNDVAKAVMAYQENAGLGADGIAGPATIRALNGVRRTNKLDAVLATMERWRWLPRDLGRNYSMLNIPDFTLKVVRNGQQIWTTRVVVGKSNTKTPLISDSMKFITVNPTWNVPPSIIANEYLPALQQDPTVLDRMGLKLEENRDGTVRIYQPPGEGNALGRLRFNFPNKFLVYQHDTPDKNLFARDVRAYSHGCMRVQDPAKYAEVLLSITMPKENYTQERIRSMFGPSEITLNFPTPLNVHITYQTAYVDGGKLVIRDDIYGHDAALMAQVRGSDRRVADVPIKRQQVSYSREELRMPNGVYYGGFGGSGPYRTYGGGPDPVGDFFRRIFR